MSVCRTGCAGTFDYTHNTDGRRSTAGYVDVVVVVVVADVVADVAVLSYTQPHSHQVAYRHTRNSSIWPAVVAAAAADVAPQLDALDAFAS